MELTHLLSTVATEDESIPVSESEITEKGVRNMILKMQRSDDTRLIVASANDKIIAFAEMERDKFETGNNATAKLGIVVDKKYRRKGIGRALIEILVEQARSSQIRKINLLVPTNNVGAVGFYRRLDFTEDDADSETPLECLANSSPRLLMSRVILPNTSESEKSNS